MSESDEYNEDEPLAKHLKHDVAASDRLTKLDNLFSEKLDRGPPSNHNLAKSLNRGIGNDFSMGSVLDFAEFYKRPDNCDFLCVQKLNEELFFEESINSKFKKNDGVLQKTQLLLTKGMITLFQLKDKLLKKIDTNHESEIFDLATDSLQLLAYTHKDISNVRWKFLKPAVAQKYKRLCSAHVPLSSYLLGDDLDKQLKSINEWKGIGVQMTHEQSRKRFHEKSFQQPSTPQCFIWGKIKFSVFFVQTEEPQAEVQERSQNQKLQQQQLQQQQQDQVDTEKGTCKFEKHY